MSVVSGMVCVGLCWYVAACGTGAFGFLFPGTARERLNTLGSLLVEIARAKRFGVLGKALVS